MAKIEKIGNIQVIDNKEDMFFYFPMISMACTGSGYWKRRKLKNSLRFSFLLLVNCWSYRNSDQYKIKAG